LRWRPPQLAALAPPPGSMALAPSTAGAAVGAPPLRPRPQPGPSREPAPRPGRGGRGGGGATRRPFPIDPGSRGFRAGLVGLVVIALGAVAVVPTLVSSKHAAPPGAPGRAAAGGFPEPLYVPNGPEGTVVVGENLGRVDFRDPNDFRLIKSIPIPGSGPNHLDFSGDGSFLVVTTELDGKAFRIDTKRMAITGQLQFPEGSRPVDVMLVPEAASMPSGSGSHSSSSGESGMASGESMASMGYLG